LLECDEIFAVCYIGRATTDASVMSAFDRASHAKLSHVGIVCTNSDASYEISVPETEICKLTAIQSIEAQEAKNDWPDKANTIERFLNDIATDKRDIETIEEELKVYEEDDDESDEKDPAEELELRRRSKSVKQVP
jgi:hypothetical protein